MRHGGIAVTFCGIDKTVLPRRDVMAKSYRSVTCPKCRKIILRNLSRKCVQLEKQLHKTDKKFWDLTAIYDRSNAI